MNKGITLVPQSLCDLIVNHLTNENGNYLEIGSYYGKFISEIAAKFPNNQFNSIDPFIADGWTGETEGTVLESVESVFIENTQQYTNIKHFKKRSCEFVNNPDLIKQFKDISCVLIDGSHHKKDILCDIELATSIITNKKLLIIFDDLHIKDVNDCVELFKNQFKERIFDYKNLNSFASFTLYPNQ